MDYITFTKQETVDLARLFLDADFRHVCDGFLHPARAALAFDIDTYPVTDDSGDVVREFLLERVVATFYEFVKTGCWTDGDTSEYESIFEDFVFFQMPPGATGLTEVDRSKFRILWDCYGARMAIAPLLDDERFADLVSLRDIALFAGMSEETVRVATFAKGDAQLRIDRGAAGVERDEAVRWLKVKGRFVPSRFDMPHVYSPKQELNSVLQFCSWFGAELESAGLTLEDLIAQLNLSDDGAGALKALIQSGGRGFNGGEPWFTPQVAVKLGKLFKRDPSWITRSVLRIAHEERLCISLREVSELAEKTNMALGGIDIADDMPLDAESMRKILTQWPGLTRHLLHTKPNSKMDGYQTAEGHALTHQHELKKQYLWIAQSHAQTVPEGFEIQPYPAKNVGSDLYGRHSGLKKYPELATADLVRIHVRTAGELKELLLQIT